MYYNIIQHHKITIKFSNYIGSLIQVFTSNNISFYESGSYLTFFINWSNSFSVTSFNVSFSWWFSFTFFIEVKVANIFSF